MKRRLAFMAAALAVPLFMPPVAAAAPPVSYSLVGTSGANGWFTSNVTLSWTVDPQDLVSTSGCDAATITAEGTTTRTCSWTYTWGTGHSDAPVKIDKTAPTGVAATFARPPDANGWYNRAVGVAFAGTDAVSGIASCSSPTYAGVDSASAALSGACTDVAGNTSASASIGFKYDATAPAVTPSVDRPPDGRGWYRKPLTVSFAGTDVTSGIASCSAPTRYAGPDLATAAVVGSCRDAAGNVAEAGHAFQYDATAPKLPEAKAQVEKGVARIVWKRSADAVLVELERTPGVNGRRKTVVYRGNGVSFADKTVRNGIRYRYVISAADAAGNVAQKVVTTVARRPLYRPATGAVVRAPVVLAWDGIAGAKFYNLQLLRQGVKVLSTWPRKTTFRLRPSWRYAGRNYRLEPGRYTWYVWPATGTLERPRYGRPLGTSTFVVTRT